MVSLLAYLFEKQRVRVEGTSLPPFPAEISQAMHSFNAGVTQTSQKLGSTKQSFVPFIEIVNPAEVSNFLVHFYRYLKSMTNFK